MPPKKPASKRQNRVTKTPEIELVSVAGKIGPAIPSAPDGIRGYLVQSWAEYWSSSLAQVGDEHTKRAAVTRLWQMYDLRDKHYEAYRAAPLVDGSQGQKVLNPLGRQMSQLETQIMALEDRLGLNPKAQIGLGISWAQGQAQLASLAERVFHGSDESKSEDDEIDPRELVQVAR
jgi:phage terminase small subunit